VIKKNGVVSVMGLLLFTKILGFFKLRIIAQLFGASHDLDIFWAAFTIPDMIFSVIVAGSVNAAIIPIFTDILYNKGKKSLDSLFNKIIFVFSGVLLLITIFLFIFTPEIAPLLISSNKASLIFGSSTSLLTEDVDTFITIMRVGLVSPFVLGLSSFITAYLQAKKQFFVTSLAPAFYNLGMIIFSIVFVKCLDMGIYGLALSSIVGTVLHFGIQIPAFIKYYKQSGVKLFRSLKNVLKDSSVIRTIKLATPRIFSILAEQINIIVNTVISFTLTPGTLSSYKFAYSLHMFPINIIGSAVAQVTLPDLTQFSKEQGKERFKKIFNNAVQFAMYLVLPIVSILIILRLPIVRLTYGTGAFDWQDTILTSWCLVLLGFSIICQTLMQIIVRAFYALKDTWKVLIITLIGIVVNITFVYFLTNFFSHYYDWRIIVEQIFYQISHANSTGLWEVVKSFFGDLWTWMTVRGDSSLAVGGLAVGVSMTYLVEVVIGFLYLNKTAEVKLIGWKETVKPLLIKILNAVLMAIGMYFVFKIFDFQLDTTRTVWVALLTLITAVYGGISYILGSYLLNIPEFKKVHDYIFDLINNFRSRLRKKNA